MIILSLVAVYIQVQRFNIPFPTISMTVALRWEESHAQDPRTALLSCRDVTIVTTSRPSVSRGLRYTGKDFSRDRLRREQHRVFELKMWHFIHQIPVAVNLIVVPIYFGGPERGYCPQGRDNPHHVGTFSRPWPALHTKGLLERSAEIG